MLLQHVHLGRVRARVRVRVRDRVRVRVRLRVRVRVTVRLRVRGRVRGESDQRGPDVGAHGVERDPECDPGGNLHVVDPLVLTLGLEHLVRVRVKS